MKKIGEEKRLHHRALSGGCPPPSVSAFRCKSLLGNGLARSRLILKSTLYGVIVKIKHFPPQFFLLGSLICF